MEGMVIAIAGQHTPLADEAARQIAHLGGYAALLTWGSTSQPQPHAEKDAPGQLSTALRAVRAARGRLDGLIFIMPECGAHAASSSLLDAWSVGQTGLTACLHANVAAGEAIRDSGGQGAIVNVIPVYGVKGVAGHAFDAAAMGGALSLTRALGVEWAAVGVRVNAVLTLPPEAADSHRWRETRIPNRRPPTPAEIWSAIHYLLGPEARYVTAEALPADGGWLAYDYF